MKVVKPLEVECKVKHKPEIGTVFTRKSASRDPGHLTGALSQNIQSAEDISTKAIAVDYFYNLHGIQSTVFWVRKLASQSPSKSKNEPYVRKMVRHKKSRSTRPR